MKNIILFMFCVISLMSMSKVKAEEFKVGVFSLNYVLQESVASKKIMEKIEKKFKKERKELEDLKNKIKNKEDDLQKKAPLLKSDALRAEYEEKVISLLKESQEKEQALDEQVEKEKKEKYDPLVKKIVDKVHELSKNKKLVMTIDGDLPVYYIGQDVDLTPEIMDYLDKEED